MYIHQFRSTDGTGTLSYILVNETTRTAAIIDPNREDLDTIRRAVKDLRAKVSYIIETHTHVDHVSAAQELKNEFRAQVIMHENTKNKWKVVDEGDKFGIGDILRENAKLEVDRYVIDGDIVDLDGITLKLLHTPGHTDNHIAILAEDNIFTGDLLLIGQAGRSDLPGGSAEDQYDSLMNKIATLPENTKIWPGHDYEENEFSFLRDEKRTNPFLQQSSKEEYKAFVAEFFPPLAEATADGEHMTVQCGTKRVVADHKEPFKDVSPDELEHLINTLPNLFLLDVREPFELTAFGNVPNVVNIPTGELLNRINELPSDKSKPIVTICQSGSRSYEVAHYLATRAGFTNVYNLESGTSGWMYSGKPVEKGAMSKFR